MDCRHPIPGARPQGPRHQKSLLALTGGLLRALRERHRASWEAGPSGHIGRRSIKGLSKAQQAFQRGLTALAQWGEREGQRPVPRGHSEEIVVDGESEPVIVKLGVWISNTKSRRDRLDADQQAALRQLGVEWA